MKDNISIKHSIIIFATTISFITTSIILDIPLYFGLFSSILFSLFVFYKIGFKLDSLLRIIWKGVMECTPVYVIVLLIGGIIALWIASGIVPTIIYFGFGYLQGTNYLLACFIVTLIVSVIMGTPLGTISTIGIALLAIGKGLLLPDALLIGAIVSGAFVADKVSPLASLVNLTIKTHNIKYKEYIRYLLVTQIPLIITGIIIYYLLGRGYTSEINPYQLSLYQEGILNNFSISSILLLFPVSIIVLAIIGIKIIPIMSMGLLGGILVSFFLQNMRLGSIINILLMGYKVNTGVDELNSILKGGGIVPMLEVILVIIGAIALSSLFEGTNMIRPIISSFIDRVNNRGDLILRTAFLSSILTIVTCDQTVGILLLGKMLKEKFNKLELNSYILARTITDSGTVIAPLIPWNSNSIIILAITGVSALEYGPYAVLCFLSPIATILIGYINSYISSKMASKEALIKGDKY